MREGERREAEKGEDASVGGMRGESQGGGTEGRNKREREEKI